MNDENEELSTTENIVEINNLIKEGTVDYGNSVITNMFPNVIDGLKRVQSRIIFTASNNKQLLDRHVQSTNAIGSTKDLHPHGDVPIYMAIVNMSQSWNTNPVLIKGVGNFGSYKKSSSAAAARYTSLSLSDYTKDVFLDGINLNKLPDMIGDSFELEPQNLIPALPQTLIMASLSIGMGYQSRTVSLYLNSVCDLVTEYTRCKHNNVPFIYSDKLEWFLPNFPSWGYITNGDQLLEEYKNGNFNAKINLDGAITLYQDKIIIHTVPYGIDYANVIEMIMLELLDDKNGKLDKYIDDIVSVNSKNSLLDGSYAIKLKRNADVFEIFRYLKQKYSLSGVYAPNPNYVSWDSKIYNLDYIQLLEVWLKYRSGIIKGNKVNKLKTINTRIIILEAMTTVLLDKDDFISIVRNSTDMTETSKKLIDRFGISPYQATQLLLMPISNLLKSNIDKLNNDKLELQVKADELSASMKNILLEIGETAQILKKKYDEPKRSIVPKYLGYVKFKSGYIQFETHQEVQDIIDRFDKWNFKIYKYKYLNFKVMIDEYGKPINPKKQLDHKHGNGDIQTFKENPYISNKLHTVKIVNGSACYVTDTIFSNHLPEYFHTTDKSIFVERSGKCYVGTLNKTISKRKNIDTSGAMSDIIHVLPYTEKPIFVLVLNSAEPNVLRIYKIDKNTTKLRLSRTGDVCIETTIDPMNTYLNIDSKYISRMNLRVLYIKDLNLLFPTNKDVKLELNSSSVKRNSNIVFY